MEIIVMVAVAYFVIKFIFQWSYKKNLELEEEVKKTPVINDPRVLAAMGYRPLVNLKNKPTSMMDSRPGAVIKDYKSKGWEVTICPTAFGRKGGFLPPSEFSSLWGKYEIRVV